VAGNRTNRFDGHNRAEGHNPAGRDIVRCLSIRFVNKEKHLEQKGKPRTRRIQVGIRFSTFVAFVFFCSKLVCAYQLSHQTLGIDRRFFGTEGNEDHEECKY
jgi:hypothetical protein